ncbi:hypothetical protein BaRGS_00020085 [Batillaria attramentaria]|uniref:Secreted protein n=1 Tax=Batillaria attramentaria TaxID=370345 RepID=A0ABD0KNE4_9CAEN
MPENCCGIVLVHLSQLFALPALFLLVLYSRTRHSSLLGLCSFRVVTDGLGSGATEGSTYSVCSNSRHSWRAGLAALGSTWQPSCGVTGGQVRAVCDTDRMARSGARKHLHKLHRLCCNPGWASGSCLLSSSYLSNITVPYRRIVRHLVCTFLAACALWPEVPSLVRFVKYLSAFQHFVRSCLLLKNV